jgi:hypothetical protein
MPTKTSLLELVSEGKLALGTPLTHRSRIYRDWKVAAKVTKGGITLNGREYKSPSGAAFSLTQKPVDGWYFWKLPDGRSLDDLRKEP